MTRTLNVGLIGSGFMGQAHADAFRRAGMLYRDLPARPRLYMLADASDLARAMDELGMPLVVKIPDGSFSRGVHKVNTPEEFRRVADELLDELLADHSRRAQHSDLDPLLHDLSRVSLPCRPSRP